MTEQERHRRPDGKQDRLEERAADEQRPVARQDRGHRQAGGRSPQGVDRRGAPAGVHLLQPALDADFVRHAARGAERHLRRVDAALVAEQPGHVVGDLQAALLQPREDRRHLDGDHPLQPGGEDRPDLGRIPGLHLFEGRGLQASHAGAEIVLRGELQAFEPVVEPLAPLGAGAPQPLDALAARQQLLVGPHGGGGVDEELALGVELTGEVGGRLDHGVKRSAAEVVLPGAGGRPIEELEDGRQAALVGEDGIVAAPAEVVQPGRHRQHGDLDAHRAQVAFVDVADAPPVRVQIDLGEDDDDLGSAMGRRDRGHLDLAQLLAGVGHHDEHVGIEPDEQLTGRRGAHAVARRVDQHQRRRAGPLGTAELDHAEVAEPARRCREDGGDVTEIARRGPFTVLALPMEPRRSVAGLHDHGHRRRVHEVDRHHRPAGAGVDEGRLAGVAQPDHHDRGALELIEGGPVPFEPVDEVGSALDGGAIGRVPDDRADVDEGILNRGRVGHRSIGPRGRAAAQVGRLPTGRTPSRRRRDGPAAARRRRRRLRS